MSLPNFAGRKWESLIWNYYSEEMVKSKCVVDAGNGKECMHKK